MPSLSTNGTSHHLETPSWQHSCASEPPSFERELLYSASDRILVPRSLASFCAQHIPHVHGSVFPVHAAAPAHLFGLAEASLLGCGVAFILHSAYYFIRSPCLTTLLLRNAQCSAALVMCSVEGVLIEAVFRPDTRWPYMRSRVCVCVVCVCSITFHAIASLGVYLGSASQPA